jgi:signal transduction histidine kinase
MDDSNEAHAANDDSAWVAFVGGLRTSLAHDLRTPLGAIANYAALLEQAQDAPAAEVQNVARQIRRNVIRTVTMLEQLATASSIAASTPVQTTNEPPGAVRDVLVRMLSELGAKSSISDSGFEESSTARLDRTLLEFAWRAYLAVERDVSSRLPEPVEVQLEHAEGDTRLTLIVGVGVDPQGPAADIAHFLVQAGERARLESRHALRLAEQLVRLRGGTLELRGRAGNGSTLRLRLPER